jgi:hypothetical protein
MSRKKVHVANPINQETLNKARTLSDVASGRSSEKSQPTEISNMIKELIFIGKLSKNVNISGFSFTVGTLTEERQRMLISRVMRMTDEEKVAYAKVYTVSEAVTHINDISIDEIAESFDEEENIEVSKINFFGTLQSSTVDILYKEYENLLDESKTKVGYEDVKK